MGVDFKAVAVLGIGIEIRNIPKLKKTAKVPAFEHNYSEEDTFHPKSGKKLWTDETREIDSANAVYYIEDDEIYQQEFDSNGSLSGKSVCNLEDHNLRCYTDEDGDYIVGIVADGTYSNGGDYRDFEDVPDGLKETLKELLTEYGLWKEEDYGLHCVLDYSC
jgi:hypothetical protein